MALQLTHSLQKEEEDSAAVKESHDKYSQKAIRKQREEGPRVCAKPETRMERQREGEEGPEQRGKSSASPAVFFFSREERRRVEKSA